MNYPKICSLIGELKLIGRYLDSWARVILEIKFFLSSKNYGSYQAKMWRNKK